MISGIILPRTAPTIVPEVQPIIGMIARPAKYLREISPSCPMATAKISSVMAKPRITRQSPLNLAFTFCESEIPIRAYREFITSCVSAISIYVPM